MLCNLEIFIKKFFADRTSCVNRNSNGYSFNAFILELSLLLRIVERNKPYRRSESSVA